MQIEGPRPCRCLRASSSCPSLPGSHGDRLVYSWGPVGPQQQRQVLGRLGPRALSSVRGSPSPTREPAGEPTGSSRDGSVLPLGVSDVVHFWTPSAWIVVVSALDSLEPAAVAVPNLAWPQGEELMPLGDARCLLRTPFLEVVAVEPHQHPLDMSSHGCAAHER